jgi:hypothetical protein
MLFMSSGSERDPMCGVIMQGNRVVGSICIPEQSPEFIEEFNNCYGPLRMQVAEVSPKTPEKEIIRSRFRLPTWYRQAWQPPASLPPPASDNAES